MPTNKNYFHAFNCLWCQGQIFDFCSSGAAMMGQVVREPTPKSLNTHATRRDLAIFTSQLRPRKHIASITSASFLSCTTTICVASAADRCYTIRYSAHFSSRERPAIYPVDVKLYQLIHPTIRKIQYLSSLHETSSVKNMLNLFVICPVGDVHVQLTFRINNNIIIILLTTFNNNNNNNNHDNVYGAVIIT